jgi:hypothetical protein
MGISFDTVLEILRRRYLGVGNGRTSEGGQYYDRAIGMRFVEVNEHIFASDDGSRTMWLYVNRPQNKICCGDKPWAEAEQFRLTGVGKP